MPPPTTHDFNFGTDIYDLQEKSIVSVLYEINEERTPEAFIEDKTQLKFFKEYFGSQHGVNARFVIVERSYTSKDYLTDYSSYYALSFSVYPKSCTRLHFFSSDLDKENFISHFKHSIVTTPADNKDVIRFWRECYLGYMVIKPTPGFFIGFTLLKHYNFKQDNLCFDSLRSYWGVKDYKVNVFGKKVTVSSLAFQEQDRNVAACATIAIWSMLQIAAEDYYINLQSPWEITKGSGTVAHNGNRLMPNKGLSILQMAQTITNNHMATEVRVREKYYSGDGFNAFVRRIIYAYSPLKIPLLLAFHIPDDISDDPVGHVVAVCGFKIDMTQKSSVITRVKNYIAKYWTQEDLTWKADYITKLYAHDDQWGPFSMMEFFETEKIGSSWDKHKFKNGLSTTSGIIIPVYQKIRVPYDDIENKIVGISKAIEDQLRGEIYDKIIWEIQIMLSADFKEFIKNSDLYDINQPDQFDLQFKFLTRSFPKYIWVCTVSTDDAEVFRFIYDATGLSGSNLLHTVLSYYPELTDGLIDTLETNIKNKNKRFSELFDYNPNYFLDKIREFRILPKPQ